jgi:hypothetical protein
MFWKGFAAGAVTALMVAGLAEWIWVVHLSNEMAK